MEGGLLCLKWRDHRSTFFRILSSVRKKEMYCDATIACDGRFYPVHKLILSACSDYFEQMFELSENKNLMIVLTDISHRELETLLDYMYFGEVNILQSDLSVFMKAAEHLQIKGLAEPSESVQKKQMQDNKRNLANREDGTDTKRRRLNVDENQSRLDTTTPQSNENHVVTKEGETLIQKEMPGTVRVDGDIVSPTQLASVELSSESSPSKRPEAAPTLLKMPDHNRAGSSTSSCGGSQVKLEDYSVKEEPEDWPQAEASENSQMINFSDPGLAYLAHTSNLPLGTEESGIGGLPSHSQPSSEELQPHPLPGPSRIQPQTGSWEQQPLPVGLPSEGYPQYRGTNKGVSPAERKGLELNHDGKPRKRGRCGICPRKNDKKSAKQCSLCLKWVCKLHCMADGRVVLCDKCRPQQWFPQAALTKIYNSY